MKNYLWIGLVLCAAVSLAVSATAVPEMPTKSPEVLRKMATHVAIGVVDRVYSMQAEEDGYKTTHYLAELTLESQEKGEKLDPARPLYVRWFRRKDVSRTQRVGSNGHYGWAPGGGERVRVYLARNAHDGFDADANRDGGFNAIVPNGFERVTK